MKNFKYTIFLCLALCLFMFGCNDKDSSYDTEPASDDIGIHIESPKDTTAPTDTFADTTNEITETETDANTDADTEPSYILNDTPDNIPAIPTTDPQPDTEADTDADIQSDTEYQPEEKNDEEFLPTDTSSEDSEIAPDIIDLTGILSVDYPSGGQFVSHQSEKMKLLVNYECTMLPTGIVQIDLEVGLESYDINCGARTDTGKITVDGETQTFSTDALVHEGRTKTVFPFTWYTYQSESGQTSCEIDVSWMYNGTYAGEKIDSLTANAVFKWD